MNKKWLVALIALVLVVAAMVTIYIVTRPEPEQGGKEITVVVVHKDGSERTFTYQTEEEYLDKVLLAEELVEGEITEYGLTVYSVDGERADWAQDNAYWCVYIGEEMAITGVSEIVVEDGKTYSLVYTPM